MEYRSPKPVSTRPLRSLNKSKRHTSNKKQTPLCTSVKNHQDVVIKAFEHSLKKSKSSGRVLAESPYLQHTFRSRLVKLLKPKSKPELHRSTSSELALLVEDGTIRVELQFRNIKIECHIKATDTDTFAELLKKEIVKACNERGGNFTREAIKIVGFETVGENRQIDYILTLSGKIPVGTLQLRPLLHSKQKEMSLKDFKIIKTLGSGGFSQVYLVRSRRDGNFYAMKLMQKQFILENQRDLIVENQRYIMEITDSPFLVKMYSAFETKRYFAFIVEYCSGGELFYRLKKVKRMSEEDARFYFLEILFGIKYLHSKNILYRDLKPENLLIGPDGHIKIADFGLAKPNVDNKKLSYSFCGSPQYMAPQMLCKTGHSFTLDYYCIGALLYELVTGLPPYYSKDHDEIYESILSEQLSIPPHLELSSEIQSFLKSLLHKNPKLRLGGYNGIKQILIHPWLGKLNHEAIQNKKLTPPFIPDLLQFNFDDNTKEQGDKLHDILEQQESQSSFETHFADNFKFEFTSTQKESSIIERLKAFDTKEQQRQKVLQISQGMTSKQYPKRSHRSPLKLRNINTQFSVRLRS